LADLVFPSLKQEPQQKSGPELGVLLAALFSEIGFNWNFPIFQTSRHYQHRHPSASATTTAANTTSIKALPQQNVEENNDEKYYL
jgi:hypothetical protein